MATFHKMRVLSIIQTMNALAHAATNAEVQTRNQTQRRIAFSITHVILEVMHALDEVWGRDIEEPIPKADKVRTASCE